MSDETPQTPADQTRAIAPVDQFLRGATSGYYCSVQGDKPSDKMRRYAMREGDSEKADKYINREIVVVDVLLHETIVTNDKGEVKELLRAVLMLDTGEMFGTCSSGILGCLQTAMKEFGKPTWAPGLRFQVINKSLANNRHTFKLVPVFAEVGTKKGKA